MQPLVQSVPPNQQKETITVSLPPEIGAQGLVEETSRDRGSSPTRRRALVRAGIAATCAAALGGMAFLAARTNGIARHGEKARAVATPGVKATPNGQRIRWRRDAIDVVMDQSFTDLAGPSVFGGAVDAWRKTGASLPSVSTTTGRGRKVGYNPNGPNENVVVFAPYGWAKAHGALAVTVLTFDDDSGEIVDADIVLNGGGRFFQNFDHDESGENSDEVSIEDVSSATNVTTQSSQGATPRFDIQSVITHELGHFFGLGEDYEDNKATMYIKTRPGEIHKRVVTANESNVISALYAETPNDASDQSGSTKAGCGRAQMARGDAKSGSLIGFAVAATGVAMLAAARRRRAERLPVRVVSRASRVRKIAQFGGFFTAAGFLTLAGARELRAGTEASAEQGDAEVQIIDTVPKWTDGLLETDVTFRVTKCRVGSCPAADQHVVLAGGSLGGITQLVGPFRVPQVGTRLTVDLRNRESLDRLLKRTFQP